jgi:hypothetical protein
LQTAFTKESLYLSACPANLFKSSKPISERTLSTHLLFFAALLNPL